MKFLKNDKNNVNEQKIMRKFNAWPLSLTSGPAKAAKYSDLCAKKKWNCGFFQYFFPNFLKNVGTRR